MNKITCDDTVAVLKKLGRTVTAVVIADHMGGSSRSVATALRMAVADGRVHTFYKNGLAHYRFKRNKPIHNLVMKGGCIRSAPVTEPAL